MAAVINKDTCLGCGACVGTCPVEALSLGDDGKPVVDEALCISCGACAGGCPVEAITVE